MKTVENSTQDNLLPVIFLMGPTASGKTNLAMELYNKLDCELISVDSALVYRGLDIGTAKPETEELRLTPHHLIDICEPCQPYSASQFVLDARTIIDDVIGKKKIPVLVGGTMLYFKALKDGLADLPTAEPKIREQIRTDASLIGWKSMHEKLSVIDPESASRITMGDTQRIQRALEVFMISGKTMSQYFVEQKQQILPYPIINLAIVTTDRQQLRKRITIRFEKMLAEGFIEEVEHLYQHKGLSADLPAMRSVGYRQVCLYLAGEIDYQMMKEKAITATCRLAKRQMTWLRKWPDLNWLETADNNYIRVRQIIDDHKKIDKIT